MRKGIMTAALLGTLLLAGCAGMREGGGSFSTHAQSFRIVGISIPHDDKAAAMDLVPANGQITTITSTPADWTSFWGFFGNLFGFHWTSVSGTK